MTRRQQTVALTVAGILVTSASFAHHTWPVDRSTLVTVRGTVTGYEWSNPHVMIALEVKSDAGKVERWNVGGPSTERMAANGWDRTTLKPGDVITGIGYRFTDGQNVVRLEKIVMSTGKEMFLYGRR